MKNIAGIFAVSVIAVLVSLGANAATASTSDAANIASVNYVAGAVKDKVDKADIVTSAETQGWAWDDVRFLDNGGVDRPAPSDEKVPSEKAVVDALHSVVEANNETMDNVVSGLGEQLEGKADKVKPSTPDTLAKIDKDGQYQPTNIKTQDLLTGDMVRTVDSLPVGAGNKVSIPDVVNADNPATSVGTMATVVKIADQMLVDNIQGGTGIGVAVDDHASGGLHRIAIYGENATDTTPGVVKVDSSLSTTSTNPVQNKVVAEEIQGIKDAFDEMNVPLVPKETGFVKAVGQGGGVVSTFYGLVVDGDVLDTADIAAKKIHSTGVDSYDANADLDKENEIPNVALVEHIAQAEAEKGDAKYQTKSNMMVYDDVVNRVGDVDYTDFIFEDDRYLSAAAVAGAIGTAIPGNASKTAKGVVKVGDNIDVANDGTISVPVASATTPGVVTVEENVLIDSENPVQSKAVAEALDIVMGAIPGNASKTAKGVVKVGNNINVNDGTISVPAASASTAGVVKVNTTWQEVDANPNSPMTSSLVATEIDTIDERLWKMGQKIPDDIQTGLNMVHAWDLSYDDYTGLTDLYGDAINSEEKYPSTAAMSQAVRDGIQLVYDTISEELTENSYGYVKDVFPEKVPDGQYVTGFNKTNGTVTSNFDYVKIPVGSPTNPSSVAKIWVE